MDSKKRRNDKKIGRICKKLKCIVVFLLAAAVIVSSAAGIPEQVSAASLDTAKKIKITNVSNNKKNMYMGSSFALKANGKVKAYASSKPLVVSVDENGILYAKAQGKAKITVTGTNGTKTKISITVKKAVGYSVSKKAGTYSSAIKVQIKAKKGYKIYYAVSGKFKTGNVIQSGKKKTVTVKKTMTLAVYAVKNNVKITAKQLKRVVKQNKYIQYQYTIVERQEDENQESETIESSEAESENPESSETKSSETGTEEEIAIQTKIDDAAASISINVPEEIAVLPSVIESDTPQITISSESVTDKNLESGAVTFTKDSTFCTLTILQAGTYAITGGTQEEPLKNFVIAVGANLSDEVNLIWDNLFIDNSAMGVSAKENVPVFSVGKSTERVNITLKGTSMITGNGNYTGVPAAIISAGDTGCVLTFSAYDGDSTAGLIVLDGMNPDTDFGSEDPADGIYSKGTLVLNSGNIQVTSNGECLKGTGKGGKGGIIVNGGAYTLRSNLGSALKSKNGVIAVKAGNIKSVYTAGDGIQAKNYDVIIIGGTITIDQCYGDGIQGENVYISGKDTVLDIKTYFENAGINYYNTALGSGNYNTLTTSNTTKKEVVNVDTGSHKGIKGGTKSCTYSYQSVTEGSGYTAGESYTKEASGGIVITGGTITVDTTNTGIKYNGGQGGSQGGNGRPGGSQGGMGSGASGSGNLSAANNDGQYIIGSPDDGIHSNHTCMITGGNITIASSDDGITAPDQMMLLNGCKITINQCYEGIEGGEIFIGASKDSDQAPNIKIYSDDDGLNAASDASVSYVYTDESEGQYTKTRISAQNNVFQMLDGYLNIMIGDDVTHSFSLATADGTETAGTYTSDGDGIDCNGSFYAYGGTIIVYGSNSGANSPIDSDDIYYIGNGVTLLAAGGLGMTESPDTVKQAVITYSSTGNTGGMGRPGGMGGGSSSSISAGTVFAVLDGSGQMALAIKPIKTCSYVLYSSPDLVSGASYQLYSGGIVSGSLVHEDNDAYDYRYTEYSASGASSLGTITAR